MEEGRLKYKKYRDKIKKKILENKNIFANCEISNDLQLSKSGNSKQYNVQVNEANLINMNSVSELDQRD